ncbi:MAG: polysaccharide biosynthesis protein [Bacteroidales bacterium]|jgi:O-antigen/teichoic acid export membrane protein|nr:polysaccharide biosynthesis protein [Bacteroidales bacterium]
MAQSKKTHISIVKNTFMLYTRQILILLVSLYTVRIILSVLGAEDYGIYNVVAGIITMLGFLSSSMSEAIQRYFSFEIGKGNLEQLEKIFCLSLIINIFISVIVFSLAETIGLWFVRNKLNIPLERIKAAQWVYQCSIISFMLTLIAVPFTALILAHEDMYIYAQVSIIETALKLASAFLLRYFEADKLQLYGILISIITLIITLIYSILCKIKYRECKFRYYWNLKLFSEIAGYTGWNLLGSFAFIIKKQIIDILINQYFNPIVVATRSIASMVNSAVTSFSTNFIKALNPQIVKTYAAAKRKEMISLLFSGTKGAYFLMYLFSLPLFLEAPQILFIWLKDPPVDAILFIRLVLIESLASSLSYPMNSAAIATGKMKTYQLVLGGIIMLNLPFSWIALSFGAPPYAVMLVSIGVTFAYTIARVLLVKWLVDFSIYIFLFEVMMPLFFMTLLSCVLPLILYGIINPSLFRLFLIVVASIVSICVFMYLVGLNINEKIIINKIVLKRFRSIKG